MRHYISNEKFKTITLVGSTKFKKEFEKIGAELTMNGNIVFGLSLYQQHDNIDITEEKHEMFKQMILQKIDISDEIYVVNPGGYIGESTMGYILYAYWNNKKISYSDILESTINDYKYEVEIDFHKFRTTFSKLNAIYTYREERENTRMRHIFNITFPRNTINNNLRNKLILFFDLTTFSWIITNCFTSDILWSCKVDNMHNFEKDFNYSEIFTSLKESENN